MAQSARFLNGLLPLTFFGRAVSMWPTAHPFFL